MSHDRQPAFPTWAATDSAKGMDLRDYFAAKALAGLLAEGKNKGSAAAFASEAYKYADAMMLERRRNPPGAEPS